MGFIRFLLRGMASATAGNDSRQLLGGPPPRPLPLQKRKAARRIGWQGEGWNPSRGRGAAQPSPFPLSLNPPLRQGDPRYCARRGGGGEESHEGGGVAAPPPPLPIEFEPPPPPRRPRL